MAILEINDLSFRYPDMDQDALNQMSLSVTEGEFLVLCGPSGCGKTTFLRLLKTELAPVGTVSGEIYYKNKLLRDWDERTLIEEIGLVFQDPENQIIMDEVMQEIVFGLENLGYSNFEMRKRVAETVHAFGMEHLLKSKPSELSGGQKQMLNLLSTLLLKPKVLLLDEPTSQLDPVAAKDLIVMLERLNQEMGITIIMVEHRLEELFAVADRVLMLDEGKVAYQGVSRQIIDQLSRVGDEQFTPYLPSISRFYLEKEPDPQVENIPLTVKESKAWLASLGNALKESEFNSTAVITNQKEPIIELKDVYFQYERDFPLVLKKLSIRIKQGDYYAIVGGNGSGKTTLLKTCLGITRPQRGTVHFRGRKIAKLKENEFYHKIAYLPQNPRTYFIQDTIEKEMLGVIEHHKVDNGLEKVEKMLEMFKIAHLRHQHPYDCSGGEMQKAALASMLLGSPEVLFMDEPTKGLDPVSKRQLSLILNQLHQAGLTIVMVTHDIEFAAQNASNSAMMFDGGITVDATPDELFKGNHFYTTAISRATQNSSIPEALTLEEALKR